MTLPAQEPAAFFFYDRKEERNLTLRLSFGFALLAAASMKAQMLTSPWVELGEGGQAIARVVVDSETCPSITVDGASQPMSLRQPVPDRFRPACEFALPAGAAWASIDGYSLPLPGPDPASIIVIGDTGCRIKGDAVQDCSDMSKWPLKSVADNAASLHPDLIIHVGDYLYRETACPPTEQEKCGGTPIGDNWETWNADFFAPAANLLGAAPLAFSRGNHENCKRSWRGWFYYLDPRPWTNTCADYTPPYVIRAGTRQLVMLDSSATEEDVLDREQVAEFTAELGSLHVEHAWLVDHHPFWGIKPGTLGKGVKPLSAPLEAAWAKTRPMGIEMILSGHVHMFSVIPFDSGRPLQIVAGDGGTALSAPVPESVDGTVIQGNAVHGSQLRVDFGYIWLRKSASASGSIWDLRLQSTNGVAIVECSIASEHTACGSNEK
jgi:hypothetical protein